LFGRTYFMITDSETQLYTPVPVVVETAVVVDSNQPTTIPTSDPTATPSAEPTQVVVPATAEPTMTVVNTSVQYVMAQTDLNIRSGPGTNYQVIGWLAEGQIAKVTGISSDSGWWRVICPDDTVGSCWLSAHTRYSQPTSAPGSPSACTDAATFVSDVTVSDGTVLPPGTGFNKTWRIRNSGTCTWNTSYKMVHTGGPLLDAVSTFFPLRDSVAPGQSIDLTINMVSPTTPGNYQSDWKLQNAQGQVFGVGTNRNTPFWVKITVANPQTGSNGSISGFAWQDKDRDNIVDANEMLPNVTITLATGAECRTIVHTTQTDGNGRFVFANLVANAYCLFGTDGSTTVSQSNLVLGQNQQISNISVSWPPVWSQPTTISGFVYHDLNQNGSYDGGETLVTGRDVWLIPGTACQVRQNAAAVTYSGIDGRYTFSGSFNGSYCVGLTGGSGLDDVIGISVNNGQ
ncbi:MAG: NBR1-Ig-like domain-containing protein, partial [Saprospiraceae bacterium]|nr:NBR1-Ig-like domain-containing protein [Saprospiraceae bacterium]